MRSVTGKPSALPITGILVLLLAAAGCGGSTPATTEEKADAAAKPGNATPLTPVLAKAHLADAAAAAKKWHSDAFLIQVAARNVKDDGTVPWWEYGAYSPSAKTCLVITFVRGNASTEESGGASCAAGALPEFIDSDQVIKIARANGITHQSVAMFVSESTRRPGQANWSVIENGMREPGNTSMDIDGATGKVTDTTKTP